MDKYPHKGGIIFRDLGTPYLIVEFSKNSRKISDLVTMETSFPAKSEIRIPGLHGSLVLAFLWDLGTPYLFIGFLKIRKIIQLSKVSRMPLS
jgi:hypothetical protein